MQYGINQKPVFLNPIEKNKLSKYNLIFFSMNNITDLMRKGLFTRDGNILSFLVNNDIFRSIIVIDGLNYIFQTPI